MALFCINFVISYLLITNGFASTTPPKSVNLAVETSFLFEPEDVRQNANILTNVRQFLDKLEDLLTPGDVDEPIFRTGVQTVGNKNDNGKNGNDYGKTGNDYGKTGNDYGKTRNDYVKNGNENGKSKMKNSKSLTKFLTELGGIMISYDESEIHSITNALNNAVVKNAVKPEFHEMFPDKAIQMFIKNTVKEWTTTDPMKLKEEIAKYILNNEVNGFVTFFQNINQFFEHDKSKLEKLVKKFVKARKTKQFGKPFEKIFSLIFERFRKMDNDSKHVFRKELKKLTKYVVIKFTNRLTDRHDKPLMKSVDIKAKDYSESIKKDEEFKNKDINDDNEIGIDKNLNVRVSVHTDKNPKL